MIDWLCSASCSPLSVVLIHQVLHVTLDQLNFHRINVLDVYLLDQGHIRPCMKFCTNFCITFLANKSLEVELNFLFITTTASDLTTIVYCNVNNILNLWATSLILSRPNPFTFIFIKSEKWKVTRSGFGLVSQAGQRHLNCKQLQRQPELPQHLPAGGMVPASCYSNWIKTAQ